MAFKKIPKEEWFKMSQEERDYYTLEFNQSVENRRRLTLIVTRVLALLFIGVLFYIGFVQFQSAQIYDAKIKQYGPYAYCALCGEYNFKQCECQYATTVDYGNFRKEINYSQIQENLIRYNSQECKPFDQFIKDKEQEILEKLK